MAGLISRFWISRVRCVPPAPDQQEAYPFHIPAVQSLQRGLSLESEVTFLVGDNGCGKSTILEAMAIAHGFNAEGGTVHLRSSTRETHSELHRYLELSRGRRPKSGYFLRAESYYNILSALENIHGEPLHERSHGETFWELLANHFRPQGLYLLDEPEAALSPQRQLAALCRLWDLAQQGCQFIIATHSPIFLAYPGARILLLDQQGITASAFDDLPLVRAYRGILADPQRVVREMLADDQGSS